MLDKCIINIGLIFLRLKMVLQIVKEKINSRKMDIEINSSRVRKFKWLTI